MEPALRHGVHRTDARDQGGAPWARTVSTFSTEPPQTTDIGLDESMQDEAGGHDPRIAGQRRLPVVNRDKRLVGISALGDLAVGQSPPPAVAANARNARRT